MVRRYRRRFTNKKRRRKRKRNVSFYNRVNKAINGTRRYKFEHRGFHVEFGQDTVKMQSFAFGEKTQLANIIDTTLGKAGAGLGGGSNANNEKYLIYNHKAYIHVRNTSEHAVFLSMYECVQKHNDDSTTKDTAIINHIINGLQDEMGLGSSGPTDIRGQALFSAASNELTSSSEFIQPYQSKSFNRQYKIVKAKHFKLGPGDDVYWPIKIKSFVYNTRWQAESAYTSFRGVTKYMLFKLRGLFGHSNVAGQEGTIGLMNSHLAWGYLNTASVVQLGTAAQLAWDLNKDDMTGITLQGATDYEHKDEGS